MLAPLKALVSSISEACIPRHAAPHSALRCLRIVDNPSCWVDFDLRVFGLDDGRERGYGEGIAAGGL